MLFLRLALLAASALSAAVRGRMLATADEQRGASAKAGAVNTTTCNGRSYAYTELAGYGYVSGGARDKFGDTIGGIGSAAALERGSWSRSPDGGTYTGLLWAMPDRGWWVNFLCAI